MAAALTTHVSRRAGRSVAGRRSLSSIAQNVFVFAILVLFTVSGGMLWYAGYNYDGLTGSAATKIHPGTYLVLLTFAFAALQAGNPVRFTVSIFAERPASLFLLAAAVAVFAQTIYRAGPGMAGIIDTEMLPPFISVLFMASDKKTRARLEIVIHAALIANAVLGLVEFGTKHLYFPYRFDGAVFPLDTRSSALQGHPLGNATMTAVYILALVGGGGTLSLGARAGVIALEAMALVTFGGRSAIVVVVVLGAFAALVGVLRTVWSGRVNLLAAAATVLAVTAVPMILVGLSSGGFFDALLTRFSDDGGSANTRVEMLTLIHQIPMRDLIIGPDPGLVDSLRRINGLEEGIENPIVRTMLYQGFLVLVLWIAAISAYLFEVSRTSGRGLFLSMLGFIAIVNTFESLASKSTMLAKFAILILVLFRPDRVPWSTRAGSGAVSRPSAGLAIGGRPSRPTGGLAR